MKFALIVILAFGTMHFNLNAQQQHTPVFLHEPANWEYEQFPLPPSFAPAITYEGIEELRFAPGMFKKDSANYYTYIFMAVIEGSPVITEKEVQHYLVNYYRGLSATVANDRKLNIDTSKITALAVRPHPVKSVVQDFDAAVTTFGVFDDGAVVTLNMEITAIPDSKRKKTFLIFLASPKARNEPIWKELYDIRNGAMKRIAVSGAFGSDRKWKAK